MPPFNAGIYGFCTIDERIVSVFIAFSCTSAERQSAEVSQIGLKDVQATKQVTINASICYKNY
jgi:hypothetical protein